MIEYAFNTTGLTPEQIEATRAEMEQAERCPKCDAILVLGSWPFCPHGIGHSNVNGDEIPGGMWQENGFRHPRQFFYKSDLKRALAAEGKEMTVRHVTIPGTDKSPFTTDWSKGSIDAQTLENARILMSRNGSAEGNDPEPEPLNVKWQVRDVDPKAGPGPWRDCEAPR